MSGQSAILQEIYAKNRDDIDRLAQDVQNGYSFAKVSFIYGRLKRLGPWMQEDLTMELIFEIDMMQSALAIAYARVFVGGSRKIGRDKVPVDLRSAHDAIMELRNKRYAHDDNHASVDNFANMQMNGKQVTLAPGSNLLMCLGAPPEWEAPIKWLGEYLVEQSQKQLQRLTDNTGLEWVQPTGPAPNWL